MSARRETPLYRALYRSNLIWGGDRKLMLTAIFLSAILIFSAMNLVGFVTGVLFGSISVYWIRKMAKKDPILHEVYFRQLPYQKYYAPFSRHCRVSKSKRAY